MDLDLQTLAKDKRVWAAAGVAAAVGLVVLVKNRGRNAATGSGNAVTGTASGPSGSYVQGTGDTTGTDIASYLGGYQQSLQGQLTQYQQQLTDALATLPKVGDSNPYGPQTSA